MNKKMRRNVQIAACCISLLVCAAANAQVTIGSGEPPVKGALLDLKSQIPNTTNNNTTTGSDGGGLVLPRVELTSKTTLEPFIKPGDSEWQSGPVQDKTKKDHIGLLVYNVKDNNIFHPGIYVWKGESWVAMKPATDFIYLPSFNLTWGDGGDINLFEIYKKNYETGRSQISSLGGSTVNLPGYSGNAGDFYYVVTDYDPKAIGGISINSQGRMTYGKGTENTLPEDAYINIVMIRKY